MSGRTLVVTNDFPPRTGGIESFVLAMAPADARRRGGRAHRPAARRPAVRRRAAVPGGARPVAAAAADTGDRPAVPPQLARAEGCDRVWFGAAAPLGLMAAGLRAAGVQRTVATTHGHEVWWATRAGRPAAAAPDRRGATTSSPTSGSTAGPGSPRAQPAGRERGWSGSPRVWTTRSFHPGAGGEEVRRRHGLGERPVVVCVSRMVARKGQDVLVRALPAIRRRVPDAALLLVGDGPHRRAVRAPDADGSAWPSTSCSPAGCRGRRPRPTTTRATVFCMPTRTRRGGLEPEALGICYLEAAATGLPVVAGDSGGAPDAVLDGESGYVVDGRDVAAVADRCARLLADPDLAGRFGSARAGVGGGAVALGRPRGPAALGCSRQPRSSPAVPGRSVTGRRHLVARRRGVARGTAGRSSARRQHGGGARGNAQETTTSASDQPVLVVERLLVDQVGDEQDQRQPAQQLADAGVPAVHGDQPRRSRWRG